MAHVVDCGSGRMCRSLLFCLIGNDLDGLAGLLTGLQRSDPQRLHMLLDPMGLACPGGTVVSAHERFADCTRKKAPPRDCEEADVRVCGAAVLLTVQP